ncbi:MAG TPA: hypothetical protein VEH08_03545 [Methanomassiliicoccales archaeon]|nr:hypothetical protein [Methanomassiliicoccales archaeon]
MENEWPLLKGDYRLGNPESPVAVLVIGRGIVALPPETYNILGTMKTENLGIEKVLVNLVSNPRIRFLVVCGPEEFGHFPGDAITKLAANGVDERKRIVGPRSAIPYLCNIPREVVERFRGQIEVVDLVHPKEAEEIIFPNPEYTFDQARTTELLAALEDCRKRDPGRYPEPPIIALSRALTMDASAAVHSIDRMAIDFTSQMLRLPSERLSTEASLVELSHTFGLFLDPVDGVVQEAPSVEFAEKLRRYYRGGS